MKHLSILAVVLAGLGSVSAQAQVGTRSPSEKTVVNDAVTGVPMTVLTSGKSSDSKIYQTHPQWTSDGKWIVFRTSGRASGSQAYAVNEEAGDIVQLTEGPGIGTGALNLSRKEMKLYFARTVSPDGTAIQPSTRPATEMIEKVTPILTRLIELDLGRLLTDSMASTTRPAADYERICATLPAGTGFAGGMALDADEKHAYVSIKGGDVGQHLPPGIKVQEKPPGARMGTGPGGLRSIDLQTGETKLVIDTPFQIGHVQCNPWVTGEIIYCHETGGDAPQRMWTTMADGTGNRPLFAEGPDDWVTHEAVVTKDEVMFNLIGHKPRLRLRPTGIAVINLRTNAVSILGQIDESQTIDGPGPGGFWHCNGSHDGKWAAGDTFSGNVWLINRADGKRTLLTTDHKMKPDHCHPTFDETGTKILIQSGHFTNGERLSLIVLPVPKE